MKLNKCLEYLSLQHDDPEAALVCLWQKEVKPDKGYLIYRWLHAVYFVTTCLYHFSTADPIAKYLIYWTTWGYLFCVVQSVWVLILYMIFCFSELEIKTHTIYRFFHIVALDVSHAVTMLFWVFVYKKGDVVPVRTIFVHGVHLAVMLIDFALVAHPTNLLHLIYPLSLASLYTIFNFIYYSAGGTGSHGEPYIYRVIDWRQPGKAIVVAMGSLVLLVFAHVLVWGLDKLKKYIRSKGENEYPV